MAFESAFNGDTHLTEAVIMIRDLGVTSAIETGTFHGRTTELLSAVFDDVVSIESNPSYYKVAKDLLSRSQHTSGRTSLVLGSSDRVMDEALAWLPQDRRVLAFLDAHWNDYCPIEEELASLSRFKHLDPVIMIHDFRNPHKPELGYDVVNKKALSWEYLGQAISQVYSTSFQIFYNGKAVGSRRGVIFCGHDIDRVCDAYGVGLTTVVRT